MEYIGIAKSIADLGFQTTFTAVVLYFAYKYMDTKFFKDEAKIARKYNLEQDEKENQESKSKLKTLQIYLEENQERIYAKGIDRVSVWLNHNGTRNGKIHFIFYSLIAEISKRGLQKHIENPV